MQVTQLGHVKDLASAFTAVLGNSKAHNQVHSHYYTALGWHSRMHIDACLCTVNLQSLFDRLKGIVSACICNVMHAVFAAQALLLRASNGFCQLISRATWLPQGTF